MLINGILLVFSFSNIVTVAPQILHFDFGEESVNSGDLVSLTCTVHKGDLPMNITWTHDNESVSYNEGIMIGNVGKKISTISIDSVQAEHSGTYTCAAQNAAGKSSYSAILHVNVTPQILHFDFGEDSVNSGDLASLQCTVHKGDLPMNITWSRNNKSISYSEGIMITNAGKKISTLSIYSVEAEHSGTYTCTAHNAAGKSSYSAMLNVNVAPQILHFDFGDDSVNSGDLASLTCSVHKGDLPMNITWSHNNESIGYDNGIMITNAGKKISTLSIDSVGAEHSGTYTCTAQNAAGKSSYSAVLNVNVAPQIIHFDFGEDSVNSGDPASLTCTVHKGDSPMNITWSHNNKSITYNDGILITNVGKKISTISIDSVRAEHSGTYTCTVQNFAGKSSYSAVLLVNVLPLLLPLDFGEDIINTGESASLMCSVVKGDLPIDIVWFLNNKTIGSADGGISIARVTKKMSTLSIESVQEDHAGEYTCLAKNEAGSTVHSTILKVNVPPQISPFDFGDDPVNYGDIVSLTCSVNKGDLPVTISWMFNGQNIENLHGVVVNLVNKRLSTLSIESVKAENSGEYKCVAHNNAGLVESSAYLHVNVLPHITPFEFEGEVNTGDSVQLNCYVSKGDIPLNITWLLKGKEIQNTFGINTIAIGTKTNLLTINSVQAEHAGIYTCRASNRGGEATQSAELFINVLPHITPFSFEEEANAGDSVQVSCYVNKGDMPVSFSWMLNGEPIPRYKAVNISPFGSKTSVLSIDSADGNHAGNYTCIVTNRAGISTFTAELVIKVGPHITPFEFEGEVNTGDSVQLTCYVSKGDIPLNITWLLNGKKIQNTFGINMISIGTKTNLLTINSVQAEHAGVYTCRASNKGGEVEQNAELFINGTILNNNVRIFLYMHHLLYIPVFLSLVLPHITPFSFEEEANAGESVQVTCYVNKGDMPVSFSWMLNGEPIPRHKAVNTSPFGAKTSLLSIDSVDGSHAGNYTCVVANRAGISSFAAELVVKESITTSGYYKIQCKKDAPFFSLVLPRVQPFSFGEEPLFLGETATVQCSINAGDLPVKFSWMINGKPIRKIDGFNIGSFGARVSVLSIDAVSEMHSGNYTCLASNNAGITSYTSELVVKVLPRITPFYFEDNPVHSGQYVQVSCSVTEGDLPIKIEWQLNGKLWKDIPDLTVTPVGKRTSSLEIESVSHKHSGLYTCKAANKAGEATLSTELQVNVPPQITPFDFGEIAAHSGQLVQVSCTVSEGDLPVTIKWRLNDQSLDNFPDISTTAVGKRISILAIDSVSHRHAGDYTCIAQNRAGVSHFSSELLVNVPPQIIPFDFGGEPVYSGEFIQVYCTVRDGDLPIRIEWLLNGKAVDRVPDVAVSPAGKRASTLSIESVRYEHSGNYSCVANNNAGSVEYSTALHVNGLFIFIVSFLSVPPQITPFDFGNVPVHAGQFVQVSCTAFEGDMPIYIDWLLNGASLEEFPEISLSTVGKRTSFLSIDSVSYTHAGNYTCQAKNQASTSTFTSELQVNVSPQIAPFDFGEYPVHSGQSVQVQCFVSEGDLPVNLSWFLNEQPVEEFPDISTTKLGKRSSILSIDSVSYTLAGNYSCRAKNEASETSFSSELQVNVPPQITPFDFGNDPINSGDMVTVFCTVNKGDVPIGIKWTFNGRPIDNLQGVSITRTNKRITQLTIDSVQDLHSGDYKCAVKNQAGVAKHSASLHVNGT
ncbi:hypothetical protein JTB14_005121 [Gonioctena quinquepunctata]|nr:hypothetical protein JTB14_005121 [Gonioctena quinquepunctata]